MRTFKIYAENVDGQRRFIEKARAENEINLFSLYSDECGDDEEIVVVVDETSAAAASLGRIRTEKKAQSSRENGKKGGRPVERKIQDMTRGEFIERFLKAADGDLVAANVKKKWCTEGFYYAANAGDCDAEDVLRYWFEEDMDENNYSHEINARI